MRRDLDQGRDMAVTALTQETFGDFIKNNDVGFIDFWAEWCGPCRLFAPIFEKVAERHPDVAFGKVDTEEQPELAGHFNIMSIPTLMAFRSGVILYAEPGALPEEALEDLLRQVLELDMEKVLQEINQKA